MSKIQFFTLSISVIALVVSGTALTNQNSADSTSPTPHESMLQSNSAAGTSSDTAKPTMPGQEAFGTIQEIMSIVEQDPHTDWSKVDLEALRQHLIDMNELTMNTQLTTEETSDGIHIVATGETSRTIAAIQRMVATHDQMTLQSLPEWDTTITKTDTGIDMRITAQDPQEIAKLQGLGFIGIMATGADHPTHHLMMARGAMH